MNVNSRLMLLARPAGPTVMVAAETDDNDRRVLRDHTLDELARDAEAVNAV
jgi:hypothetical protein